MRLLKAAFLFIAKGSQVSAEKYLDFREIIVSLFGVANCPLTTQAIFTLNGANNYSSKENIFVSLQVELPPVLKLVVILFRVSLGKSEGCGVHTRD